MKVTLGFRENRLCGQSGETPSRPVDTPPVAPVPTREATPVAPRDGEAKAKRETAERTASQADAVALSALETQITAPETRANMINRLVGDARANGLTKALLDARFANVRDPSNYFPIKDGVAEGYMRGNAPNGGPVLIRVDTVAGKVHVEAAGKILGSYNSLADLSAALPTLAVPAAPENRAGMINRLVGDARANGLTKALLDARFTNVRDPANYFPMKDGVAEGYLRGSAPNGAPVLIVVDTLAGKVRVESAGKALGSYNSLTDLSAALPTLKFETAAEARATLINRLAGDSRANGLTKTLVDAGFTKVRDPANYFPMKDGVAEGYLRGSAPNGAPVLIVVDTVAGKVRVESAGKALGSYNSLADLSAALPTLNIPTR